MLTPEVERRLDGLLRCLKVFRDAEEISPSPVLPIDFALAKKYRNSFPQHALEARGALESEARYLLSPTCCYPIFRHFEGATFAGDVLITNKSNCFRNEVEYVDGIRQISFTMREYVLFAIELSSVKDWIEGVKAEVPAALETLGITVSIIKATDPFFNPQDFQQLIQTSENLKGEFIHNDVALGSINLHLKAFSKSCSLKNENGDHMYTACFGLGYDRVCSALGGNIR
jgi:hypothetical protein